MQEKKFRCNNNYYDKSEREKTVFLLLLLLLMSGSDTDRRWRVDRPSDFFWTRAVNSNNVRGTNLAANGGGKVSSIFFSARRPALGLHGNGPRRADGPAEILRRDTHGKKMHRTWKKDRPNGERERDKHEVMRE
jgi:hypothetical protein